MFHTKFFLVKSCDVVEKKSQLKSMVYRKRKKY